MQNNNWVDSLGNQIGRGATYISENLSAPNIVFYAIYPAIFFYLVMLLLLIYIRIPITGEHDSYVCVKYNNQPEKCSTTKVTNRYNILYYILVPIMFAIVMSAIIYKTALYVHNPKFAATVVGAHAIRNVFR
jgi:hypothetical protein